MKKKVALIGLNAFENLGDQVLCDSTSYLIKRCGQEYEVIFVNQYPQIRKSNIWKPNNLIYCAIYGLNNLLDRFFKSNKIHNALELLAWRMRLLGHYKTYLKDVDAVIMAGGTIKYSNQGVNYAYEFAVKQADKYNIPFMFNAMSIEAFNEKDSRCLRLKKILNNDTVKMISTRDGEPGVDELRKNYISNPNIQICAVGDPAFWASEVYGIQKKKDSQKVGIGLIRTDIFKKYGKTTDKENFKCFYKSLINKLNDSEMDWSFFSNGLQIDHIEGENLIQEMKLAKNHIEKRPSDTKELVRKIAEYKCVIGARMHSQILAYALDIPMVGIEWDTKILRFFTNSNCEELLIREDEMNPELVLDKLFKFEKYDVARRDELRQNTLHAIMTFLSNC